MSDESEVDVIIPPVLKKGHDGSKGGERETTVERWYMVYEEGRRQDYAGPASIGDTR